ncbi:MAG: peptidyl-prolyl cis-trans isomerase [Verrucomicrobiota bacterium]
MTGKLRLFGVIAVAGCLGLIGSELLSRSASFRDAVGRLSGRGHLLTITNGKGIYETDLDEEVTASDLVTKENLRRVASKESVDPARIDREISLFKAEFGQEKTFAKALHSSGLSVSSLREKIGEELRGLDWLEKQIGSEPTVPERACRNFYEAHLEFFTQPVRYRASHLFLAAHAETPPETIEEKAKAIEALALRLSRGEAFSQLAAETSEDETTKSRGGDFGFFSENRMAPEFFAEVKKLRPGETSKPFRTHLGFHIVRLDEMKPARLLSFDEARAEILAAMANEQRVLHANQIVARLSRFE